MPNERKFWRAIVQWWPSILMMAAIFGLSSQPAAALPDLGWADTLVKKGGHVLGYAALAVSYWGALGWKPRSAWPAFALAVAYGLTDEFHQLHVAGRQSSIADVVLFDAPGAVMGLLLVRHIGRRRLTEATHPNARVG